MEKTKLGLSVAIMGAIVYLTALFGGFTPLLLVAGYILIVEENADLKKTALTALMILLTFSAVNFVIGLLPDVQTILLSLLNIFGINDIYLPFINNIANFLYSVIGLLRELVFIFLAGLSILKKPLKLPFIDKLFD